MRLVFAACAVSLLSSAAIAGTFPVTTTADNGVGTLRQSMLDANSSAGADTIDLTRIGGTISLLSPLPIITENVTIVGPGSHLLTITWASTSYASIIKLSAGQLSFSISGVTLGGGINGANAASLTVTDIHGPTCIKVNGSPPNSRVSVVDSYLGPAVYCEGLSKNFGFYGALLGENSTVVFNRVTIDDPAAGGVYVVGSYLSPTSVTADIRNSYVNASGTFGSLYVNNASAKLNNATLAGLVSVGGVGGTAVRLRNSIVAGCSGSIISYGYNAFGSMSGCTNGGSSIGDIYGFSASDISGGVLKGKTQLPVWHLDHYPSTPGVRNLAIDTGSCLDMDLLPVGRDAQFTRRPIDGACDKGSTEFIPLRNADFDYSERTDLVWRNVATGENALWLFAQSGPPFVGRTLLNVEDPNWRINGVGDFNGDRKPDLVWRNYGNGRNAVWLMNEDGYVAGVELLSVDDTSWAIVAVADFNFDGKDDLLWRNSGTGENRIWLMNGTTYTSGALLSSVESADWAVRGAADFNYDDSPDLLWQNTVTGELAVWYLDGTTDVRGNRPYTDSDTTWQIVAVNETWPKQIILEWRNTISGELAQSWYSLPGVFSPRLPPYETVSDFNWKVEGPR